MATGKRKKLTISEKVKIIQEVEKNPRMPTIEIAQKFNLAPSSLFCIMKNKQLILDAKEVEEEEEAAVQEEDQFPHLVKRFRHLKWYEDI
jgi:hypothetical protein